MPKKRSAAFESITPARDVRSTRFDLPLVVSLLSVYNIEASLPCVTVSRSPTTPFFPFTPCSVFFVRDLPHCVWRTTYGAFPPHRGPVLKPLPLAVLARVIYGEHVLPGLLPSTATLFPWSLPLSSQFRVTCRAAIAFELWWDMFPVSLC